MALDVFRGITVALMLLVNNVALDNATPAMLLHAPWGGGVRLADARLTGRVVGFGHVGSVHGQGQQGGRSHGGEERSRNGQ